MKNLCLLTLCGFLVGSLLATIKPVYGIDAFKKEFVKKYVKADAADGPDKAFAEAVKTANCNVCHAGKTNKKTRNEYGKALDELLDKKADIKNTEKIQEALEKVAGMKSDPKNSNSPTFGELIQQGKLPGGDASTTTATAGN
jgi:cytochrome c553